MRERMKDRMKEESAFLAQLMYVRGMARYGSTYIISTVSSRLLTVRRCWVPEDNDWSIKRPV